MAMTWVRHYASHYYAFWSVLGGLVILCLIRMIAELRAIRKALTK